MHPVSPRTPGLETTTPGYAVRMIRAVQGDRRVTSFSSSVPYISGMRWSVMIRLTSCVLTQRSARSGSGVVSTS